MTSQPPEPVPAATPAHVIPAPVAAAPAIQAPAIPGPATPTITPASIPRSPERPMTPEMDVEMGGTPEPETTAQDMALDGESDAIVQQLEKGLPRWEGFGDAGWTNDIPQVNFQQFTVRHELNTRLW